MEYRCLFGNKFVKTKYANSIYYALCLKKFTLKELSLYLNVSSEVLREVLSRLESEGLVTKERDGHFVYFSLSKSQQNILNLKKIIQKSDCCYAKFIYDNFNIILNDFSIDEIHALLRILNITCDSPLEEFLSLNEVELKQYKTYLFLKFNSLVTNCIQKDFFPEGTYLIK